MNFTSHADAVVAVAVELVNALTPGEAYGRPHRPPDDHALPAAVTAALRAGRSEVRPVSPDEAAAFRPVAAAIRSVFDAVAAGQTDAAVRLVNDMLATTGARPRLDRHDGEPWHLHFHAPDTPMAPGIGAGQAAGLAFVLGSEHADRIGVCSAESCDRVYVDVSRNGTKRYCSTVCQNRVKTATFRARRAAEPGA